MTAFAGKVAVVTGGASGIGRAIALELARRGASVALADINEQRLEATVAEILDVGADALGVRCDVTSDEDVDRFRDATINRFGRVDVLCNNAGVAVLGPPERVAMADWEWILQVNVLGLVTWESAPSCQPWSLAGRVTWSTPPRSPARGPTRGIRRPTSPRSSLPTGFPRCSPARFVPKGSESPCCVRAW